jgi:hypothetical protein
LYEEENQEQLANFGKWQDRVGQVRVYLYLHSWTPSYPDRLMQMCHVREKEETEIN